MTSAPFEIQVIGACVRFVITGFVVTSVTDDHRIVVHLRARAGKAALKFVDPINTVSEGAIR